MVVSSVVAVVTGSFVDVIVDSVVVFTFVVVVLVVVVEDVVVVVGFFVEMCSVEQSAN